MAYNIEKTEAWNFLQEHPLGTLATINKTGTPELAAIYFFTENDFSCFFVTKVETRKFKNSLEQPMATLLSFDEDTIASIEIQGQVEIITDTADITRIIQKFQELALLRKRGYWIPPVSQLDAGQYVVCKLVPQHILFNTYVSDSEDSPAVYSQVVIKPVQ